MRNLLADMIADLPERLRERTRLAEGDRRVGAGEFVLYWLHHAMRAHENPALDVAVWISNRLQIPLLVYQAIPEKYPYASDRHHMFMLEGARNLQRQFRERKIEYAFHLERHGHRDPHLKELSDRAACIVTEEVPVEPIRSWTDRLASARSTAVFRVDSSCVVPMQIVGCAYDRAFQFRRATEAWYRQRLDQVWQDVQSQVSPTRIDLPFKPLCLSSSNLAELIAECEIDHSISTVPQTRGGSAAGYARWNEFKQHGLQNYATQRDDPLAFGTSRLSAYLHYGMISPLRIAREACDRGGLSNKFLDELLIWRELAHGFCFYRRDHFQLTALPEWARNTLTEHIPDKRPAIHTWETLARGRTGDRLWDAAQRSLLLHGELHNNVRMTWGKALLNWTRDPESALAMLIDLNHRYALDGRDPASFGGILWCLGQFDRPFSPPRPILGTVRPRPTAEHARRLDLDRYLQLVNRPRLESQPHVAIVGAGISGLVCARTLTDHGMRVTVFEKSRGVGGRMATRRTSEGLRFDHGAQYFTVRDPRFRRYVESWIDDGLVAVWPGRIAAISPGRVVWKDPTTPRFVGRPGMNSICRHLASELPIRLETLVGSARLADGHWHLDDQHGRSLGQFDCFVTSAPAAQSAQLLAASAQLQQRAAETTMRGCWAAMLAFPTSLELPFEGAFVDHSPLSWIARSSSKPGRSEAHECWVLHASPDWSESHLDHDPQSVLADLLDALWHVTGTTPRTPSQATVHRWRYAIPPEPLGEPCLFDPKLKLGACGDWCGGPRVEGAFLSGMALAGRLLTQLQALH